jgi:predicted ester cyclase
MTSATALSTDQLKALCVRSMQIMVDGDLPDFDEVVHPDARNREADAEPPACRATGPAAFYATALWLREAHDDLRFEIHDLVAEGDIVVAHVSMSGTQSGTFVAYGPDGAPVQAFPSKGRTFAAKQTHWFRIADGQVIEHWANRDDLGHATQLGWVPPTPVYAIKMLLATRKARRQATRRG